MKKHVARRRLGALLLTLAFATLAGRAWAWGASGHHLVNKLAIEALGEGRLRDFFKKHADWVTKHAVDPDVYKRKHRAEEAPRHYLNSCEGGMKCESYPRTWKAAVDKWGLHQATKQGRLPWAIQETFDKLVDAFRLKDGREILLHATWLGHYVGDAHVPFHACANFNGQLTGQKGIHSLWEENMLDHNLAEVEKEALRLLPSTPVQEIGDPSAWAFTRIIAGDHAAHEILEKDKGPRAGGREKALFKASGALCEKRLAEAASGLASLWLTAWMRAGKPDLPADAAAPEGERLGKGERASDGENEHGYGQDPATDPSAGKTSPEAPKPEAPAPETPKPDEPEPAPAPRPAPKAAPGAEPTKPSSAAVSGPVPGLWLRDDDEQPGAIVDFLESTSAAAAAGMLRGDVVIAVDGAPINSVGTFLKRLQDYKPGDSVPLTLLRAGGEAFVKLKLP